MTKAQLKEKYLEWNREITKKEDRQNEIFHTLQEINHNIGDGHKWCSMAQNIKGIAGAGQSIEYALQLFAEYNMIEGQKEALKNLATSTANFNI